LRKSKPTDCKAWKFTVSYEGIMERKIDKTEIIESAWEEK
jgi:hypothetical protein